jgi:uncharacterized protein (TIGR03663 family)
MKLRDRKGSDGAPGKKRGSLTASQPEQILKPEISERAWWIASLCIMALAAASRLYALGLKPMHHDEGVNGFFLTRLVREGIYQYDPSNYHGPTLYYFALIITKLNAFLFGGSGLSTISVRLVPVLFGIATVWLALCLRRNIGSVGALVAAALISVSPGNIYISRYFIHEALFVFFTLGLVVAALRYRETADPVYLLLASVSAALLFATKETAIISVGVLGLALAFTALYMKLAKSGTSVPWEERREKKRQVSTRRSPQDEYSGTAARFGGWSKVALWASVAFLVFLFVNILFYTSFFTYSEGFDAAFDSFQIWAKTGTKDHGHPFLTYAKWLMQEEAALLVLGALGAFIALVRRRSRFAIFAGAWAFGILAAYSLIPYKTPWLMLNFTVPLAIIAGYAVQEIYNYDWNLKSHFLALLLASAALVLSGTQAVILNFYRYDDDRYPYVYAHTQRGFLSMVDQIQRVLSKSDAGAQTGIVITAPEYWPLPWYLRDYKKAGFFGHMTATSEPIIVGSIDQEIELMDMLGDDYVRIHSYPLRPGVTLVLFARRELIE